MRLRKKEIERIDIDWCGWVGWRRVELIEGGILFVEAM